MKEVRSSRVKEAALGAASRSFQTQSRRATLGRTKETNNKTTDSHSALISTVSCQFRRSKAFRSLSAALERAYTHTAAVGSRISHRSCASVSYATQPILRPTWRSSAGVISRVTAQRVACHAATSIRCNGTQQLQVGVISRAVKSNQVSCVVQQP